MIGFYLTVALYLYEMYLKMKLVINALSEWDFNSVGLLGDYLSIKKSFYNAGHFSL